MSFAPLSYYTADDLKAIRKAETFEALCTIALEIVARMPPRVGIVCGPITTGGAGNLEMNLAQFTKAIVRLSCCGANVFTQLPYESAMQRIKQNPTYFKGGNQLLEAIFRPLFSSPQVHTLYFLPDWESSRGARWEHEEAIRIGLTRRYLRPNFAQIPFDESILIE